MTLLTCISPSSPSICLSTMLRFRTLRSATRRPTWVSRRATRGPRGVCESGGFYGASTVAWTETLVCFCKNTIRQMDLLNDLSLLKAYDGLINDHKHMTQVEGDIGTYFHGILLTMSTQHIINLWQSIAIKQSTWWTYSWSVSINTAHIDLIKSHNVPRTSP